MQTKPKRTPEERQLLDDMTRLEGHTLSEEEENLIIDQAIFIGELPDHTESDA